MYRLLELVARIARAAFGRLTTSRYVRFVNKSRFSAREKSCRGGICTLLGRLPGAAGRTACGVSTRRDHPRRHPPRVPWRRRSQPRLDRDRYWRGAAGAIRALSAHRLVLVAVELVARSVPRCERHSGHIPSEFGLHGGHPGSFPDRAGHSAGAKYVAAAVHGSQRLDSTDRIASNHLGSRVDPDLGR